MTNLIGKNIAGLRKDKGAKQEELANFVGVSAQAVSKWENGGVPDTELLPKIADFFNVSTDKLFGREFSDSPEISDAIFADLSGTPENDRLSRAFDLCWTIEQSIFGKIFSTPEGLREESADFDENDQAYSRILLDSGYTEMGLFNRMRYFLLVPDALDKDRALLNGIDYPACFSILSDKDVFAALVFLYKRESRNAFTAKLLSRELDLTPEKAEFVIAELLKLRILNRSTAEIDDEPIDIYTFSPRPAFVSMLIFAREMIDIPNVFYVSNESRRKPYLK
ncbi:MAG: helix-turn-helix transcriptional regulator [Oscillospiraceae bacterium]|nr:helix-turn-helix transcriptional regulator [Oscillospiraceae bacterium]